MKPFIVPSVTVGKQGAFVIGALYYNSINVNDTSKMVNESHPYLLNWLISHATVSQWFQYWTATDYDCTMPANGLYNS